MFFEQLDMLCKSNNTTPTEFVRDVLRLSTSKVTLWKNGSIPKYEILLSIAKHFNVSDCLLKVVHTIHGESVVAEIVE